MGEIRSIPYNGFKAISTFSGCGGSSLGYRMAGFRVLWASEFIPAAAEVYRTNFPDTILDTRDIREVKPAEILAEIGMKTGELDLLDGSPPCASFSMSGSRQSAWGSVKSYSDTKQRTDDLFFEFSRVLDGLQPRVFIAENVKGLTIGSAKGYFKEIKRALERCGYRVAAKVLDAARLGVPQHRSRLIFFGVRSDLEAEPIYPAPLPYTYSIRDAVPWLEDETTHPGPIDAECFLKPGTKAHTLWHKCLPGESGSKYADGSWFNFIKGHPDRPAQTVMATQGAKGTASGGNHPFVCRKFTVAELRRLSSFPDDFTFSGDHVKDWERIGRAVPPLMMKAVAEKAAEVLRSCAE